MNQIFVFSPNNAILRSIRMDNKKLTISPLKYHRIAANAKSVFILFRSKVRSMKHSQEWSYIRQSWNKKIAKNYTVSSKIAISFILLCNISAKNHEKVVPPKKLKSSSDKPWNEVYIFCYERFSVFTLNLACHSKYKRKH